MPTIADIRTQYPQYDDLSDAQLADGFYQKFYSDIPREEFNSKIGLKPETSFNERFQSTYVNATPGGLLWLAKQFIEGSAGAVQSSRQATMPNPTTEEGAFIQNQGREAGPGFAAQGAGAILPMAPRGTGGIFAAPRGALRPPPLPAPSAASPVLEAAKNIGVEIPKYLSTDSMPVQRIASGLKNIPLAGDRIAKSAEAVNVGLGEAAKGVAEGFGAGSADIAGGAAKDSLSQWIKAGSNKPLNEAYREAEGLINPEIRAPLENTASEVSKIMAERANAKIPGASKAVSDLMDAVQSPDGLNYQGAKDLRSFLGNKTPQQLIAEGISPIEAKRLYGPLTRDLEGIVEKAGGEAALSKWKEANSLASLTIGQRKQLAKVIGAKGDAAPEAVYARLVGYAGSKSSADINRMLLARKAMGEDAWKEVASATVARLGRDPQGNFSPDRFFTGYGNFSPAGRNGMFGGGDGQLAKSLEDINTVVVAIKDKIGKFANPSGTAQNLSAAGMATALMHEPLTLIASVIGGRAVAEMLAKPAIAKATAEYLKAYLAVANKPSESKKLLANLASRNLATLVSNTVKTVDFKTFMQLLQGAIPARADDKTNKR